MISECLAHEAPQAGSHLHLGLVQQEIALDAGSLSPPSGTLHTNSACLVGPGSPGRIARPVLARSLRWELGYVPAVVCRR